MSTSLNRFLHGTLWKWTPNELALIISNDEYNSQNSAVNCVSVTNVSDDTISIDNIQCNQIHTIKKEALHEFMGAVPAPIIAIVKAKIQKQFNMGDDKNLLAIQETATKLIGQLTQMDSEYVPPSETPTIAPPIAPTPEPLPPPVSPVNMKVDGVTEGGVDNTPADTVSPAPSKPKEKDKVTSANKNSKEKPAKKAEPSPKSKPISKKSKQKIETIQASNKPKRELKDYTEEDEAFILDGNPTTDEVMDKFGFKDKRKVYDLRLALKKRREARNESK